MKHFSGILTTLLLAILPAVLPASAFAAEELLEPDAAFGFSAKIVDPDTVQVRYQIADGYYMYRDRFHFAAAEGPMKLGAPRLPAGTIKEDEFFGKVQTYRGAVVIELPLRSAIPSGGFTLKAVSQGCADIGVCYTPLTQSAKLVPVAFSDAASPASGKTSGLLSRLQAEPAAPAAEEEFLPVEKGVQGRSPFGGCANAGCAPEPRGKLLPLSRQDPYHPPVGVKRSP